MGSMDLGKVKFEFSDFTPEQLASITGKDGLPGKSAYDIAVEKGYSGTESEWLESLNGADGNNGKSAYDIAVEGGYSGTESEWLESLNGADGNNGKSAYDIAVEGGYSGTESEWLESLKGKDGGSVKKIISASSLAEGLTLEDLTEYFVDGLVNGTVVILNVDGSGAINFVAGTSCSFTPPVMGGWNGNVKPSFITGGRYTIFWYNNTFYANGGI